MSVEIPLVGNKKRWLILSHAFNMDGRAASQTITDKIPYLLNAGIEPIVFSAITGIQDQRFPHYQYLAWGPAAFRFDFRHWVANKYGRGILYKFLTGAVSIPLAPFIGIEKLCLGYSSQWSWAIPAFLHGLILVKQGKVDLIFTTGGAWSAHLAGLWLKKTTNTFWIAEIHDPLVIRSNEHDNGLHKRKARDPKFRYYLEQQLCKYANLVWWFTDGAYKYAKIRNPNLGQPSNARGIVVIPGAVPPTNIEESVGDYFYSSTLNICHFGSLANNRSLSVVLRAINSLYKSYPESKGTIKIHAYGAPLDALTIDYMQKHNLSDCLVSHGRVEKDVLTGRSGRERIVTLMKKSDILLLLHGDEVWCSEYIPSKMYEYFWIDRPIWAITYKNEQMNNLLSARESYQSKAEDPSSIEATLVKIWQDWSCRRLITPKSIPVGVEQAVNKILHQSL